MWYLIVSIPDLCTLTYFEFFLRNKIKRSDWLLADTCPQAKQPIIALYFESEAVLKFYNLEVRKGTRYCTAKQGPNTLTPTNNESNNKQYNYNNKTIAVERTASGATGGLNAFYWRQSLSLILLIPCVVKIHKLLSSHGGFRTYAMHHHRLTL